LVSRGVGSLPLPIS